MGRQLLPGLRFRECIVRDRRHDYMIAAVPILGIGILPVLGTKPSAFCAPLGVCQTMYGAQLLVDAIEYPIPYRQQ